jgi:predicted metal-dependent hydrolase
MPTKPNETLIGGSKRPMGTIVSEAAASQTIVPRRIQLDYPASTAADWTPAKPEFACAANAVSLLMPSVEPYFVRSIRTALPLLDDGGHHQLGQRAARYVEQESLHHRQHVRFNRIVLAAHPAARPVERLARKLYGSLERTGSPAFNLAVASASETMAYSAARWAASRRLELFTGADEVTSTLFLWHLAEEVEHKSVAWDVHWALCRHRPRARRRYVVAMVTALALMVMLVVAGTTVLLAGRRRLHHPLAWIRLTRWSIGFAFELLTNLVMSLLPGHHPDHLADPTWYQTWLREFDATTGTVPIWHQHRRPDHALPLHHGPPRPIGADGPSH